jgi:hypothetical protein
MLLGDEAIGQFVFIVGLAGKVGGEDLAAARYGFTKRVASLARLQSFGQNLNDLLPGAGFNFGIDAAVGEHFNAMFQERNKDENAGVIARVVKPVFAERCEGEGMNGFSDAIFRRDKALDNRHSAGEKTNESTDDRPEIQIFRSPRIAPEPFNDYPAEQPDDQAEQLNLRVAC